MHTSVKTATAGMGLTGRGGYRKLYPYPYLGYPYPCTRRVYPYPWPSLDVQSGLWEIFKPHVPDGTGGELGVFIICSLCVAHEMACPGFDLSNARQECKCKKLCETDFEEDEEFVFKIIFAEFISKLLLPVVVIVEQQIIASMVVAKFSFCVVLERYAVTSCDLNKPSSTLVAKSQISLLSEH